MSLSEEDEVDAACPLCSTGCIVTWMAQQRQKIVSVAKSLGYAKHSSAYKALEQASALQTKAILLKLKDKKPAKAARPAAIKPAKNVADDNAGLRAPFPQVSSVCCTYI